MQRVFMHHAGNDEKVFATVRLSRDHYWAIRAAMHTAVGEHRVVFLHGVHMYPSGFGWYKLYTTNEFRATDKITEAIKTIQSIIHRIDRAAQQSRIGIITTHQPVAFTSDNGYHIATVIREKNAEDAVRVHRPPTHDQLAALAQRFGRSK